MINHKIDVWPVPRGESPRFINETHLIDKTLLDVPEKVTDMAEEDNIRVFVPLDLNKKAILRRLRYTVNHYCEANEANELEFSSDVEILIRQIEIFDQIWYVRTMGESDKVSTKQHSVKGMEVVKEFISILEEIPDGCAESFPFAIIEELKKEYELGRRGQL